MTGGSWVVSAEMMTLVTASSFTAVRPMDRFCFRGVRPLRHIEGPFHRLSGGYLDGGELLALAARPDGIGPDHLPLHVAGALVLHRDNGVLPVRAVNALADAGHGFKPGVVQAESHAGAVHGLGADLLDRTCRGAQLRRGGHGRQLLGLELFHILLASAGDCDRMGRQIGGDRLPLVQVHLHNMNLTLILRDKVHAVVGAVPGRRLAHVEQLRHLLRGDVVGGAALGVGIGDGDRHLLPVGGGHGHAGDVFLLAEYLHAHLAERRPAVKGPRRHGGRHQRHQHCHHQHTAGK